MASVQPTVTAPVARTHNSEKIAITCQRAVDQIIKINKPLGAYTASREGDTFAYSLRIKDDNLQWANSAGDLKSMVGIIKAEVCDTGISWI